MSDSEYARRKRDERTANEVAMPEVGMCMAMHCPNRWSVDAGRGRLCGAHAWSPSSQWSAITAVQHDAATDHAYRRQLRANEPDEAGSAGMGRADAVAKMREAFAAMSAPQRDGRRWARRLRHIEQRRGGVLPSGQMMTPAQRESWRTVLPEHDGQTGDAVVVGHAAPVARVADKATA